MAFLISTVALGFARRVLPTTDDRRNRVPFELQELAIYVQHRSFIRSLNKNSAGLRPPSGKPTCGGGIHARSTLVNLEASVATADIVVQKSRESRFASFAIVVNVRDDHPGPDLVRRVRCNRCPTNYTRHGTRASIVQRYRSIRPRAVICIACCPSRTESLCGA